MKSNKSGSVEENVYRSEKRKKFLSYNTKPLFKRSFSVLLKSFFAGIMIALSGTAYINIDSRYLGTTVMIFGFLIIYHYKFKLFNVDIGYSVMNGTSKNIMLLPEWIGNFLGVYITALLLSVTRLSEKMSSRAGEITEPKMADGALSVLILSFLCGVLMFISYDGYKNSENSVAKLVFLFIPVMVFIFCGFDHFLINAFYFTMADIWSLREVWYIIIMTVGNSIGALLIPCFYKLYKLLFA